MVASKALRLAFVAWTLTTLALGNGCVAMSDDDSEFADDDFEAEAAGSLKAKDLPATFRRVALGRMYQHDVWMIPAADTYRTDVYKNLSARRIAYVCDTFATLDPTYVSGLMRFDADEALNADQIATFKGVRSCLRKKAKGHTVRFDVILNAKHYADPKVFPKAADGAAALTKRLREIKNAIAPDLYFFDFYTVPFNDTKNPWNPGAMRAGMDWIHANGGLVGGNVFLRGAPAGTDFAAIDDSNGEAGTEGQARSLPGIPLLMHIQNDPHIPTSMGVKWMNRDHAYRVSRLEEHLGNAKRIGYSYMFPVFFPLKFEGTTRYSYDARQDGDMLARMKKLALKD